MARILCVEDDLNALQLRRKMLERAGHQVDVSLSARRAVEMLGTSAYDAIVTDWRLGDTSAETVIQAGKHFGTTPVVVVSGFVSEAFQSTGTMADLYLDKPVNPVELTAILAALLLDASRSNHNENARAAKLAGDVRSR